MAIVTRKILNTPWVFEFNADPSTAGGIPAPLSTMGYFGGVLYIKFGTADIDWTQVTNQTTYSAVAIDNAVANYTVNVSGNAFNMQRLQVDTSGGAFNVTLCDPALRRRFKLKDIAGSLSTFNLTLVRFAAEKIENLASSLVLSTDFFAAEIYSDGTNWWIG